MAGPFGRLCRPLLNAVKSNVPEATYAENVKASLAALNNDERTLSRHLKAEQQLMAALKTFTNQGVAYVSSKEQVSALARCHYKGKKKGGEGEGEEEEEGGGEGKGEEEGEGREEGEEEEEGVEEEEGEGVEEEEGEEEEEDDPLGHKSPDWENWKWQGEIVYSNKLDACTRSAIKDAAKKGKIKCKGHKTVDSFKK